MSFVSMYAQVALEGIIVEKYYVSSKKDNAKKHLSGELPVGSTTYRIYVDMAPGCHFMAAYGAPGHPLEIKSSEPIYNHLDNGAEHPLRIPERSYKKNITALDSWITIGPAGEAFMGVLKEADTLKDFGTILPFEKGFFLSGGLRLEHAAEILELRKDIPQLLGVDVNSCFEIAPGLKYIPDLKEFKQKLNR